MPKISPIYSDDLSMMVNKLLDQEPKKRPSCAEILLTPFVRKYMEDQHFIESQEKDA